jgi:ABC-2 type transport system ATP-binding protein
LELSHSPLLAAHNVTVKFGDFVALDDVSCGFSGAGVCGLIGVNGAGKTTLIHSLLGLSAIHSGSVTASRAGESAAYCPDTPSFEPYLTAREILRQSARLGRRAHAQPSVAATTHFLDQVGLTDAADRRAGGFSRGMRQRLGLASALIRDPALLILDEPTSALDPVGRDAVLELVRELGSSILVVISSHILEDVDSVADTLVILESGKLVYAGDKNAFVNESASDTDIAVMLKSAVAPLRAHLQETDSRWELTDGPGETKLTVPSRALGAVLEYVQRDPGQLVSIVSGGRSLHRAFIETVSQKVVNL